MTAYMAQFFAQAIQYLGGDQIAKILVVVAVSLFLYAIKWLSYRAPFRISKEVRDVCEVIAGTTLYTLFSVCGWGICAFFAGLYTSAVTFCLMMNVTSKLLGNNARYA